MAVALTVFFAQFIVFAVPAGVLAYSGFLFGLADPGLGLFPGLATAGCLGAFGMYDGL